MESSKACYQCGSTEHLKKDCPNKVASTNNDSKDSRTCYNCGEHGHLRSNCPNQAVENGANKTNERGRRGGNRGGNRGNGRGGGRKPMQRRPYNNNNNNNTEIGDKKCFNCGGNHLKRDCPEIEIQKKDSEPRNNSKPRREKVSNESNNDSGNNNNSNNNNSGNGGGRGNRPRRHFVKCYNCGDEGHISRDCPNADSGPRCYRCNKFGHVSVECQTELGETNAAA